MKESRTTPSSAIPGATDILDYTFDVAGSPTVDRRNAYYANRAPGSTDNSDSGFKRGSVWINGADIYVCTNSTPGETQWTSVSGGGGISDAPSDGDTYGRKDGAWEQVTSGISDAPSDGTLYARQDGDWEEAASPDDIPLTPTFVYDGTANTTEFIVGDIPSSWQDGNGDLTQLSIGNSVTSIGSSAFYSCTGFTGNLVIPNSVTSIGGGAFAFCSGFTGNLVIPNSVTSIGGSAFGFCSGFTGNLVIPNSVTSIGGGAFAFCSGFTGNLVIPNSVTSIGDFAFEDCQGFTGNLIIPNSATSIGDFAFANCSGLTDAYLNQPIGQIGSLAFYYSGITNVYIGPDATGYTLGAGQTIAGKSGITVSVWTNYPNVP
jgi:hypothetical protein